MINKHYQDLSDDNLVKTHNRLFPERTINITTNNLKKCYILLYIDWGRKTGRPVEEEQIDKKTIIYYLQNNFFYKHFV